MPNNDSFAVEATTEGWLYVLTNPSMPGLVKIGYSQEADPKSRLRQLSSATGVPERFVAHGFEYAMDCKNAERSVHKSLAEFRPNPNREFFRISPEQAIEAIQAAVIYLQHPRKMNPETMSQALLKAVDRWQEEMAIRLLESGADVNARFPDGLTCYEAAVSGEMSNLAREMERKGVSVTSGSLLYAANNKDELALDHGLSLKNLSVIDLTFGQCLIAELMYMDSRRVDIIKAIDILLSRGVDPNTTDSAGSTLLWHGSFSEDITKLLLSYGADPDLLGTNKQYFANGVQGCDTPLLVALRKSTDSSSGAARALIDAGASVNVYNSAGDSPLMLAISKYRFDLARDILSLGSTAFTQNRSGEDALTAMAITIQRSIETLERYRSKPGVFYMRVSEGKENEIKSSFNLALDILARGADPTIPYSKSGRSFLHLIVEHASPEFLKAALDLKINPVVRDNQRITPLHLAVAANDIESVNLLLMHPSVTDIQRNQMLSSTDFMGRTPLQYAADLLGEIESAVMKSMLKNKAAAETECNT